MHVVTGRPGCGKSSYVEAHREDGDLTWDYDVILAALDGGQPRVDGQRHRRLLEALRRSFLIALGEFYEIPIGVWMIVVDPNYGHRMARDFGGEHVTEDDVRAWRQENPA